MQRLLVRFTINVAIRVRNERKNKRKKSTALNKKVPERNRLASYKDGLKL